jgi:hypothetical protein
MVALAIVEVMIDMPIEMVCPVIPGADSDENSAGEPFGAVVAVWGAIIRRNLIIPVRANWGLSDGDCNLRAGLMRGSDEKPRGCNGQASKVSYSSH